MSYFEPLFEDCCSCECCEMLHVCRVEVDAKTEFVETHPDYGMAEYDNGVVESGLLLDEYGQPLLQRRSSVWSKLVRLFARVGCEQIVLLFIIATMSGCLSGYLKPPASSVVRVTVVSIGLEAAYPLADLWMARDKEFGAVTITGGGSDSCIWVEKAVPPSNIQKYAKWIISCAKQVHGIYSVAIEVDDATIASWDSR